jgi:GTPase
MDREILRLHEEAVIEFEFCYHAEYIETGSKILFREGKTKGVGEVIEILN